MDEKLRNMTSIYITKGDEMLLLFRQCGRVVTDTWVGSAGGHFEENELNDLFLQNWTVRRVIILYQRKG